MSKIQISIVVPGLCDKGNGVKDAMKFLSEKIDGLDKTRYEVKVIVVQKGGFLEDNPDLVAFSDFCLKIGVSFMYADDDTTMFDYQLTHNLPFKRKSTSSRESSISREGTTSMYKSMFEEVSEIGKGGYGRVFLCKNTLDGAFYAVKQIPFSENQRLRYLREPTHMASLHHSNIVRYHLSWIEDGATALSESEEYSLASDDLPLTPPTKTLFISMEYCPSSLANRMKEGLTREEIPMIVRQMLEGMKAIHSSGIIHRDVSKHNILFGHDGQVRFTDFGLAIACDGNVNAMVDVSKLYGHATYRSPEMHGENPRVSAKSDIFSLGLIIFEMIHPMESEMKRIKTFDEIRTGDYKWTGVDERDDLTLMLDKNPVTRVSASDLLEDKLCFWSRGGKI